MLKNQNSADKPDGADDGTKRKSEFNMAETVEEVLKKMKKDKNDDPKNKKIPDGFEDFARGQSCKDLLEAMLDYNQELFRLEHKQQVLEQEARQRSLPIPQVLPSEKKKLFEKAKRMSDRYSYIVYQHRSVGSRDMSQIHSYMQFKSKILQNQKNDRYFYEMMMVFCSKVLQQAMKRKEDIPRLDEEINRLFRSNAFNISQRVHADEQRKKKYPQLKEPASKEKADDLIHRMELRFKVPKESNRQSYIRSKTEIRPLFARLTPHGAVSARSPLVSLIFPSQKDRINQCNDENLKRLGPESPSNSKFSTNNYVKRSELEKIVEIETKKMSKLDQFF